MTSGLVVGYDGSDCAKAALAQAIELARSTGDSIAVVFGFHIFVGGGEVGDYRQALRDHGDGVTAEGLAAVRAAGLDGDAVVVEDQPADGLIRVAEERGARMIVVGTRGEGLVKSVLVGSTPQKLINRSPVPVLVVPER